MATLVIAPNKRHFNEFVRQEAERVFPHAVNFRYVTHLEQLQGYRSELIVVNSRMLEPNEISDAVLIHSLADLPVRFVDLL